MKIKAKWGFFGDAVRLKSDSAKVRAGQTFDEADDEYAHILIGKGLAEEVQSKAAPRNTKPAAPQENK